MNRRTLIVAAAFTPFALATPWARADTLSSRPVRIVVPFGAGGIADLTVRAVAQAMGEQLKTQVVIENKPGAGGIAAGVSALRQAWDAAMAGVPLQQAAASQRELREAIATFGSVC